MQTILMSLKVEKTSANLDKKQALFDFFKFLNTHLKRIVKSCPHSLNSYTTEE